MRSAGITVRKGLLSDYRSLISVDEYAQSHPERAALLKKSLSLGECLVAEIGTDVCGFVVLNYSFFNYGFIPLVAVAARYRRRGFARRLLSEAQARCKSSKLFTSANASNGVAQGLYKKAGFIPSGLVENLDKDDAEVIYFKACEQNGG